MLRLGARGLIALTAFAAGLALAVVPTMGAEEIPVVVGGPPLTNIFDPDSATITQGDTVAWSNIGGTHNVVFDDGFKQPDPASSSSWTVKRTFNTVGTFSYYCDVHADEMKGTVEVLAPGSTIPPPGGGGGGGGPPGSGPPPTVNDKSAPALKLSVKSAQRIIRKRGLTISVRVDEDSTVTAKARITISGASRVLKLRKATRKLDAGERKKLKLRLSRKTRSAVASAFTRHSRLKAKLTISAKDAAGNTRTSKRTVAVKK